MNECKHNWIGGSCTECGANMHQYFTKKNLAESQIPAPCPIAKRVAESIIDRSRVGFKKYGVNANRGDLTLIEWLQHLQEELMDAAVYVEKLKKELRK